MKTFFRSENRTWIVIFAILTVAIIGLVVGIVAVNVNKNKGSSQNSGTMAVDANAGSAEPVEWGGSKESPDVEEGNGQEIREGEQTAEDEVKIDRMVEEATEVRRQVYKLSFEEALKYLDEKIAEKEDPDDIFNIRLIKINLYCNNNMYTAALAEAEKTGDVQKLGLWNREDYYNVMRSIYKEMGNEETAGKFATLWYDTYMKRTGGAAGGYE